MPESKHSNDTSNQSNLLTSFNYKDVTVEVYDQYDSELGDSDSKCIIFLNAVGDSACSVYTACEGCPFDINNECKEYTKTIPFVKEHAPELVNTHPEYFI